MSLIGNFNDSIFVWRYSDILYKGAAQTTANVKSPDSSAYIQAVLDAADTGTIYLNGSSGETLTFSNISIVESSNMFTSLGGITVTTLSEDITLKTVDKTGNPIKNLIFQGSCKGRFAPTDNRMMYHQQGIRDTNHIRLLCEIGSTPVDYTSLIIKTNDQLKINESAGYYEVIKNVLIKGHDGKNEMQDILLKGV